MTLYRVDVFVADPNPATTVVPIGRAEYYIEAETDEQAKAEGRRKWLEEEFPKIFVISWRPLNVVNATPIAVSGLSASPSSMSAPDSPQTS